MARLPIVSDRSPVTVRVQDDAVSLARSTGGGLAGPHERSGGLWIGWTGGPAELRPDQEAALAAQLARARDRRRQHPTSGGPARDVSRRGPRGARRPIAARSGSRAS
jgi:hypothetical protein